MGLQRISGGTGTKVKPSARTWNAMAAAAERSEAGLRGFTSDGLPIIRLGERVTIKNTSGGNLARGRVVELGNFLPDPRLEQLWFQAGTPADAGAVHAILLEPVTNGKFGEARLVGACVARVNVGDLEHTCCLVEAAATELKSSPIGPHRLIHAPGTGSQLCVVILGGGIMGAHGVCAEASGIAQDATGTITIGGKEVEAENHSGITLDDTARVWAYIESGKVFAWGMECSA